MAPSREPFVGFPVAANSPVQRVRGAYKLPTGRESVRCWQLIRHSPAEDGPSHQKLPAAAMASRQQARCWNITNRQWGEPLMRYESMRRDGQAEP